MRTQLPRIAAVIVNWHTPLETVIAARSLHASERRIDQVIVVDNGSGDGAMLRERLSAAVVIENRSNLGFAGGCNVGIERALADGADLLLLLNSDASLGADSLARLEAALAERSDVGIVGPMLLSGARFDRLESLGIRHSPVTGRVYNEGAGAHADAVRVSPLRIVDGVSGCAMLIRRAVLETVGLFAPEYFFGFEDLDLCIRARRAGFLTACVGSAVARHIGGRSIGASSPRRLYFATRNHFLFARRASPPTSASGRALRGACILAFNLAYAVMRAPAPIGAGLAAVGRGTLDHFRGVYGSGS